MRPETRALGPPPVQTAGKPFTTTAKTAEVPPLVWARGGAAEYLRTAFDTAALSLTVGAEEEVMLVDPQSGRLVPLIEDALTILGGDDRFHAELRASQIELVTRPSLSAADVGRELAGARVDLAEALRGRAQLLACGTHPSAPGPGPLTPGERYATVAAENPWAAQHLLTCGLHVHVALADADRALAVYNSLRSYLPEFAALGANSPWYRSADSGAASARAQLTRYLVRSGVPPAFHNWGAYAEFATWGRAGSIPDASHHWWDLRLHPGFGTLELRVCDAQTNLADATALVGLTQTLVAWLAGRYDAGELPPVHDSYRIAESLWRAAGNGSSAFLLDLESGAPEPVADRTGRLLEELAPVAVELGTERELARVSLLARACGADRQREVVRERGPDGLVGWLVDRTVSSALTYLVRAGVDMRPETASAP